MDKIGVGTGSKCELSDNSSVDSTRNWLRRLDYAADVIARRPDCDLKDRRIITMVLHSGLELDTVIENFDFSDLKKTLLYLAENSEVLDMYVDKGVECFGARSPNVKGEPRA